MPLTPAEKQSRYRARQRDRLEQAQAGELEARLARCNAAYRTLAAECAALRAQVRTLSEEVAGLEAELDSLRAEGQAVRGRGREAGSVPGAAQEEGPGPGDDNQQHVPDDWGEDPQAEPADDVDQTRRRRGR